MDSSEWNFNPNNVCLAINPSLNNEKEKFAASGIFKQILFTEGTSKEHLRKEHLPTPEDHEQFLRTDRSGEVE